MRQELSMRVIRFLFAGLAVGAVAALPTLPAAASPASVSAKYSCTTPLGPLTTSASITGSAAIASGKIELTGVVFKVKNSFGTNATIKDVRIIVPNPSKTVAPYISGSAKAASTPPGWTAGQSSAGLFALYKGSLTVDNGATISNAELSASYTVKGPKGTVIAFEPGKVTFFLTNPFSSKVSCTPTKPVPTIAKVTE
jgi:hypothetical protein